MRDKFALEMGKTGISGTSAYGEYLPYPTETSVDTYHRYLKSPCHFLKIRHICKDQKTLCKLSSVGAISQIM
jgi:hypothetical protein